MAYIIGLAKNVIRTAARTILEALRSMEDIYRQVGRRIRVLRESRGLSQEQLALNSGLHRSHMGQIERGESNVTLKTLQRVGLALKVSLDDLMKIAEEAETRSRRRPPA